ncbi:MAG: zf-HC2 domain-containing protein [Rubrobacteraceae bacterium]|uniref:anti-sigma factor family protein n=1 Tax=Rubrobacter naiadicus TaxID=1392641 RepID=UPI00235F70AC|nr:zf-HC2 domain-containing protein [Rubrobacter naiadicus]MBX6764776.1 zf-HC2 domain-containing protein [Rubrobacteraceae bacterium]MCL6439478.1 zf-HC2 domain-containing protein [Rubrobacteraceae bacterium]
MRWQEKSSGCDPARIFELVEGSLGPGEEREVREHLARCRGCRKLYEREAGLSAFLGSMRHCPPPVQRGTISRGVAMALPTRSAKARAAWSTLAAVLFVAALLDLERTGGFELVGALTGAFNELSGLISGVAEAVHTGLSVVSWPLFVVLGVGTFVDAVIAVVVLAFVRRSRRA